MAMYLKRGARKFTDCEYVNWFTIYYKKRKWNLYIKWKIYILNVMFFRVQEFILNNRELY